MFKASVILGPIQKLDHGVAYQGWSWSRSPCEEMVRPCGVGLPLA